MRHKPSKIKVLTRAVTHIPLSATNRGKLSALDAVWDEYHPLCDAYIRYFCTTAAPDATADFVFESRLSARWQRVAVQQAAGIAQSWRSNRANALAEYNQRLTYHASLSAEAQAARQAPVWTEPRIPELRAVSIQATVNVVKRMDEDAAALALSATEKGVFDLWLRISTLDTGRPIYLPVKLAAYHRQALGDWTPNSSVTLNRRKGKWWLTLTVTTPLPTIQTEAITGQTGCDIGLRHTLTDSLGQHFGSFSDNLLAQQNRVLDKSRRKAKLRACLEKKGVQKLPSTSSALAQRLSRHTQQDINYAVNCFLDAHPHDRIALETLSIRSMRFKSRRMNGVLCASQLAHIPEHIAWVAAKRGIPIVFVTAAYSSQECPHCHHTARANRPSQQTFCCQECGYAANADVVAARNLVQRIDDTELAVCRGLPAVKALLDQRHAVWREQTGYS